MPVRKEIYCTISRMHAKHANLQLKIVLTSQGFSSTRHSRKRKRAVENEVAISCSRGDRGLEPGTQMKLKHVLDVFERLETIGPMYSGGQSVG